MVDLDKKNRNYPRFFWSRDPTDPNSLVDTYRFEVIPFSAACSQFILNVTLNNHRMKYGDQIEVTNKIRMNTYVDNFFGTASTMAELNELRSLIHKHFG